MAPALLVLVLVLVVQEAVQPTAGAAAQARRRPGMKWQRCGATWIG